MGTGGARNGAGRPGYKVKAEQLQRVDIRQWARLGYLNGWASFSWRWNRGGEPTGSIGVIADSMRGVTLRYTLTIDGESRDIAEKVNIARTRCHFGGDRPWFNCPRCHKRVAVLYLRGGYFGCRTCKRVAYSTQSEDLLGRLWVKQAKLEVMLGDDYERPKRMRRITYERLLKEIEACDELRTRLFNSFARNFLIHFDLIGTT